MTMTRTGSKAQGFSLIEAMVTIAVMAILAMIAIPNFRDLMRRNQVTSASNTLLADLSYARTEAVSRGLFVSFCPANADGTACNTSGTTYDTGWIVYTYTPGNAVANTPYDSTAPATNVLLRYTQAKPNASIQGSDNSTYSNVVTFNNQGQRMPLSGSVPLTFNTCYRAGTTGIGTSTQAVQGSTITLETSRSSGGCAPKAWYAR